MRTAVLPNCKEMRPCTSIQCQRHVNCHLSYFTNGTGNSMIKINKSRIINNMKDIEFDKFNSDRYL